MEFGDITDHYDVALMEPGNFVRPADPLPDDIRIVVGRTDPDLVEQERALVGDLFGAASQRILDGDLEGWREDSPILFVHADGTLVAGGYVFPRSEALPDPGNAELRYVFTRPEWRRSGLLHHLVAAAVDRVGDWGMQRLTGSVDRAGLAAVYEGWGGQIVQVKTKQPPPPAAVRLLRRVRRRLSAT